MSDHAPAPVLSAPVAILSREHLLVMYGFVKKDQKDWFKTELASLSEAKRRAKVARMSLEDVRKKADQEHTEIVDEAFGETSFPQPAARHHIVLETASEGVEDSYFTILELARHQMGLNEVHKVSDYYAASENSAFFGNSQQRVGIQQDRVQQFLANIGKFVKELFQMVREIRIIDDRLESYIHSGMPAPEWYKQPGQDAHGKSPQQRSHAAEVTLKSIFTDMVEGGTKSPQSVFGLASQVGFTLLPDLFFNTTTARKEDIDRVVDSMQYNLQLKTVLKRKLYAYHVWKEKTYTELVHRRRFSVRYLRQHWTIIKLYMSWVKPYLRNIQRLSMNQEFMEGPDIIASFETSLIEVEFAATRQTKDEYKPIVLANFTFRTRPDMTVRREYQQGPSHMGKMDLNIRAYAWTAEQLENYKKMKKREEIELLGLLDSSLTDIMDALGEDFERYLSEAGEELVKDAAPPPPKRKQENIFSPFMAVAKGFGELFTLFVPIDFSKKGHHKGHGDPGGARKDALAKAGTVYSIYKKQKRMVQW